MPTHAKVSVASKEVEEKFSSKLSSIAIRDHERLVEQEARAARVPYLNLDGFPVSQEALSLVPEETARELSLVPILKSGNEVRLGAVDPSRAEVLSLLQELQERVPSRYVLYRISPHSLELTLKLYAGLAKIRPVVRGVTITEEDLTRCRAGLKDFAAVSKLLSRATLTELVTVVVAGALELQASDIHVEAEEDRIIVRYRIDGTLYPVATLAREVWPKLISRLKLLARLKFNVASEPQDGRFTIFLKEDKVDVRVSTIPTAFGESVVMRLLRSSATGLQFEDLGLRGRAFEDLQREVERPNGLILATGPTGSGKTTTLYAILNKLNDTETKIITLEDPVEYKLRGVNQSQVDHAAGYGFAMGLKAVLRQDPDVVMVGEIRDFETADTAINAALTGHLVISTIHTNSAAGAIPRFLAMGVKPFLMAPALNAVIGQRLVRRICTDCRTEATLAPETLERVRQQLQGISPKANVRIDFGKLKFYHGKGCTACGNLGFRGRIGIYEILTMNAEVEKLVFGNITTEAELQEIAIRNGMVTMAQDGILKALDGITSVAEVFKVAE